MNRRDIITLLGGAAATWPLAARAQPRTPLIKTIGVLTGFSESDPEGRAHLPKFKQGLAELGWIDGRTMQLQVRYAGASTDLARRYARELVDLQPDVIFADSTPELVALHQETRTIPIVFVLVADPIGEGLVASLSHPAGNMTGFIPHEPELTSKWLELLTEVDPGVKRVATLFNPDSAPYVISDYLPQFETASRSFKVVPIAAPVHSVAEIEIAIASLAHEPGGGLIVMPGVYMNTNRATIISLAARNNMPVVYPSSDYVRDGGLLSYGADLGDMFRRAAPYVDRILRGEKPGELPVQLPVNFLLALNIKTAKALGLTVPPNLLALADEVIE
jgi:putative ABC transport system substrate-binding protein